MQVPTTEQPGEPHVGDAGAREDDRLQFGAVDAEDGGHVVVALLGQRQHAEAVQELEDVRQEVGGHAGTVGALKVKLETGDNVF